MMKNKTVFLVAILMLSGLFSLLNVAFAGEQISSSTAESMGQFEAVKEDQGWAMGFGPDKVWKVKPSFDFKTVFDSNVYREPSGRRNEDVYFSNTAGIGVERQGSRVKVRSDYLLSYDAYCKNTDQNAWNNIFNNIIEYKGEKLTAKLRENFGVETTYATSEQSKKRTFLYNDVGIETGYNITDKVNIAPIYNNYLMHYRDADLQQFSYDINGFGGRTYYKITPKTDIYMQVLDEIVDYYDEGPYDSNAFSMVGGAIGKLTEKIAMSGSTGFKLRHYSNHSINDYNNWIFEGIFKYFATPKMGVNLKIKRDVQDSVYSNVGWYGVNLFELSTDYAVSRNVHATTGVGLQKNRYSTATVYNDELKRRIDWLTNTFARLTWTPYRYLNLGTGYTFQTRNSNMETYSYVDHLVDVSATINI